MKEQIQEISETFEVEVIDIGVDKAKLTLNIPRYINAIKTITSIHPYSLRGRVVSFLEEAGNPHREVWMPRPGSGVVHIL